jgi:uncharacterized protein
LIRGGALTAVWVLAMAAAGQARAAQLVVVVDDLGYSLPRAERVLALPGPVTLGMLPFAPATPAIARRAVETGHELILHQPMESLPAPHLRPVDGTLTLAMSAARFAHLFEASLDAVPGIVGVNNHTGSRLTQDEPAMRRLMAHIAGRSLIFLDSRTTADTVAVRVARQASVPALQRDVFLDHVPHPAAIDAAFQRSIAIARQRGRAIVIAHPYPVTLDYLEQALAALPDDVELTTLAALATPSPPAVLVRRENPEHPRRSLGQ